MVDPQCAPQSQYWPKWRQCINFTRFVLPLVLHMMQFSLIEIISPSAVPLTADLPNIVFAIIISAYYLSYRCLTPSSYRAKNKYVGGVIEVLLQILAVEVTLRLVTIPFYYVLYYLCVNGYVVNFVNNGLFFLYVVDGKVPVSKFVRLSRTEEGFEILRYLIAYLLIVYGLFSVGVHDMIIYALKKTKNFFVLFLIPFCRELKRTEHRKPKRKQGFCKN